MARLLVVETAYKLNGTYIISQPKTAQSHREVALPPSLAILLREHKARNEVERLLLGKPLTEDDFVFAHPDSIPLNPDTVTHAFGKLIRKAGLPHLRLHDLRHTHATVMLKEGIHPKIVQERLGHSNIATTLNI
jgi:integrase